MPLRLLRSFAGLCLIASATLVVACGGAQSADPDLVAELAPATPERLYVPDGRLENLRVDIDEDDSLGERFDATWQRLIELGFEPFDPEMANATSPVADFARYLTFQEQLPGVEVHHVVFILDGEWTTDHVDRFIQTYFVIPANTPDDAGVPYFHFVGADELPFEIEYLFGNNSWGQFESATMAGFAELDASPDNVYMYVERARFFLNDFGLGIPTGDDAVEFDVVGHLDAILNAIPRPEHALDYRPIGTLVAVAVLFGEEIVRRHPDTHWISADDAMATYFGLEVGSGSGNVLRPIDYVLQAYDVRANNPLQAYVELLDIRLRELSDESETGD